ncbi:MAG TPA: hypothetical protein DCZ91_21065 [Lachnospiraceae bacterium]|nr:hypothetical protein [Lachnospiraceae bacterium]
MKYITFPWAQLGTALRRLSLSGSAGNAAAWSLFLLIGAIPLAAAAILYTRHRGSKADILLAALSLMFYVSIWFFINPSYMDVYLSPLPMGEFTGYLLGTVLYSLLLTWILLRCILRYEKAEYRKLISGFRFLLYAYILVLAIESLFQSGAGFIASFQALGENNSAASDLELSISTFFLILQAGIGLLPKMAELMLLVMGAGFLRSFERAAFSQDTLARLERLRITSGRLLMLMLISNAGVSILQLIFARFLLSSSHIIVFPLAEIIVVLGIRMLSLLYLESKRLKEDNDMFI